MDKVKKEYNLFTPNRFIKTLSIIHLGLIAGPVIFGILIYYNSQSMDFNFSNTDDMFLLVVPVFALSGILLGDFVFKQSIKNIARSSTLKQKLMRFQTASIIKYGLVEAAAFFGIIAYHMNGNLIFLVISGLLISYFYALKPTKEKIIRTLSLTGKERDQFNKPTKSLE